MAITSTIAIHTYASRGVGSVNTYWLETPTGVVVIDAQRLMSDAGHVLADIAQTGKPVEAVVLTHHHPDHVGGSAAFVRAFPKAKVLAAQATIESIKNDEGGLLALARHWLGADFGVAESILPLPENARVTLAGLPFDVRQVGPGEASSMIVLHQPDIQALFSADVVCNAMTPFLAEQRTGAWLAQLDALAATFPGATMSYHGHGMPAPLDELIASTRSYLTAVREIVKAEQRDSRGLTPELRATLVAAIEGAFPGHVPVVAIPDAIGLNVDGVWAELQRERNTPGWQFYQKHLSFFYAKDVEGLLASDYTTDAQLISYDFAVRGHDAMRPIFTAYLDMLGDFTVTSTDRFTETQDSILLEATLRGPKFGERKVYDVFVFRGGKASHHFTGTR